MTNTESPLEVVKNNAGKLAAAFVTLVAAYGLKESADYAARTEVLGTTLGVVAKTAGYSTGQMAGYEVEVKKLGITTQATREALTQMIQAGLEIGPAAEGQVSQVAKLARAAQDLAVVTGESSSQTLTRLITNIQQMDTEGLRYMGLTVNIEQAQERFALSIGKTSDQLTQQQKTQAVANAALEQASTLAGAYEASMQNVGKQLGSLSRYQEELANSIGEKLLPAYFELVMAAQKFLAVAEQTVKETDKSGQGARGLAEGVKDFFSGISDALLKLVDIGSEIYPMLATVAGQVLTLAGSIIQGAAAIVTFGGSVDTANGKVSALGQIINVVVAAVGYFVAAVRDGMSMIVTAVQAAMGLVSAALGLIAVGVGKVVSLFNKDLGASIVAAGRELIGFGNHLGDVATETVDAFGRGDSALGKYSRSLTEAAALTKALGEASTYKDVEEQIRKLTEAKRLGHLNDVELQKSSDKVAAAITRMGGTMDAATGKVKLSVEEVQRLNTALLNVTKDSSQQFADSINNMGLKLATFGGTEYLVPLNKQFEAMSGEVLKLADNANTTSVQFQIAFSKGLDSAKTVADIGQIASSLTNAKNAGKELGDANQLLAARFEEVFAASLKAAKTKVDFELLNDQVVILGREGKISAETVSRALTELEEKATGAGDALARVKMDTAELQAGLTVAKAHLALVTAEADVGRARIGVWQAQNQYARDGSELSRENLRLAQLNLTLAQARAEQARLHYAQEQQAMQVLIALQRQLNAEKAKGLHDGEAAYIAAAAAAQKEYETQQKIFETTKQKVIKQQESVTAIEEQVVKQKLLVDQTRAAAAEADKLVFSLGTAPSVVRGLTGEVDTLSTSLGTAAANAEKLAAGVTKVGSGYTNKDGWSSNAQGAPISAAGNTRMSIANALKGYGLPQDKALSIANDFADSGGNIPYFDNPGQRKYGADTLSMAVQKAAEQYLYSADTAEKSNNESSGSSGFSTLSNQLLGQIKTSSPVSVPSSTVQSLAGQSPSKVIQVNFTNDSGQTVPVTVDAANEGALLALLQKAKGVAS